MGIALLTEPTFITPPYWTVILIRTRSRNLRLFLLLVTPYSLARLINLVIIFRIWVAKLLRLDSQIHLTHLPEQTFISPSSRILQHLRRISNIMLMVKTGILATIQMPLPVARTPG